LFSHRCWEKVVPGVGSFFREGVGVVDRGFFLGVALKPWL